MRSARAIIDITALEWNLSVVRRRAQGRKVLGMVKANAYGHGIVDVSRALAAQNIDMLGVAFVDEGIQLRKAGIEIPIMVLTPPESTDAEDILQYDLTSVVCDLGQARALNAMAGSEHTIHPGLALAKRSRPRVHVYVDTGMRRDGVRAERALEFVEALSTCQNLNIEGICTHLATSDEQDGFFLREQLSVFETLLGQLSSKGHTFALVHAANTGAIWQSDEAMFNMVRPGLSLYGYAAPHNDFFTLQPVMSIVSNVLSLRPVHAGETVSYGRRWMAPHDTTIATIPIGYGDGYLRALTGKASCLIRGNRYPVVGTICMDECMVDVGDSVVQLGDEVVLLGQQDGANGRVQSIDAFEIAGWAGTIAYDVTTSVSARLPRTYKRGL